MVLKTRHECFVLFPWPIYDIIVSSELTLIDSGISSIPDSQYGCSGKNIHEFAKINSHNNISVIVRSLHYSIQNSATSVIKVTKT